MINNINTTYDEKVNYEEKYKKFKEKQSKYEVMAEEPVPVNQAKLVSS